ncbi:MAG: DUF58 domain-containing protein [Lachnospiraceae bacterium]|nr:DUF58 domain-containing protein [Lachnospiraceae bacterium]
MMKIRFNLTGSFIYISVLILSVIFASFYGGLLPYVLLYGNLVILPVSFVYILLNYKFISIYQEIDVHRLIKGEQHKLLISFENTGLFPVHDMELILHSDRCGFNDIKDGDVISVQAQEKSRIEAGIICLYAGTYDVGLKGVGFKDVFGIFSVSFEVPYSFRAIVSPRITDIADNFLDIENTLNSIGAKSDIKREDISGNEMRDYYPGDLLSSVNWKVSARLDKLMVRIPDKQDTRRITLYMEASYINDREWDTELIKRRDYFLEFAVSSAWYFVRKGISLTIVCPVGKITRIQMATYEDFLDFYNTLSGSVSYRSADEKERMHKLVQERGYGEDGDRIIVIISEDDVLEKDFCVIAEGN